jgi:hypothetical protein
MSEFSNYLENKIVEHFFQGATVTAPANLYVALHSADPTDAGTGAELTGNGYARQSGSFGAPSNGVATNNAEIEFTATGDWSNATHFALWDASTSGNMLMYSALDSAVDLDSSGQKIVFAVDSITITIT